MELLQCNSVATPQTDETRWRNINIVGGSPTKSQTLSCIQHGEEPISTPHCVLLTPIGGGINLVDLQHNHSLVEQIGADNTQAELSYTT